MNPHTRAPTSCAWSIPKGIILPIKRKFASLPFVIHYPGSNSWISRLVKQTAGKRSADHNRQVRPDGAKK